MAYTPFDLTKPNASQDGPGVLGSANANDVALMYALIAGTAPGWAYAPNIGAGTVEQPQYMLWTNGTLLRVRATVTWGTTGGDVGNITSVIWQVSQDGGGTPDYVGPGTWTTMGATQTFTYDAYGNLLTSVNGGSFMSILSSLFGKVKVWGAAFVAHAAGAGAAVHGLGTLSQHNASAVAITGGNIDGTVIGATTRARVAGQIFQGTVVNLGTLTVNTAIDWRLGDYFMFQIGGAIALSWTGGSLPPAGNFQALTMEITNPGAYGFSWPAGIKWPSALVPTLTVSGVDILEFGCRDGSTVRGSMAMKDSK